MKLNLENYEPTELTFAACETPQDLRNKFHTLILCYDFLVHAHAISRVQRAEFVDKLSDLYELRLSQLISEELRDVSEQ